MSKHHNKRYNEMTDKDKTQNEEVVKEAEQEPTSTQANRQNNYQNKRSVIEVKSNPITTVSSPAVPVKKVNGKVLQLYKLIETYLAKCKEFERTRSNTIKLYSHFWNIGQYVLESRSREVMDAFFERFVHTAELHDEKLALRMIYELKDQIVRTKISIFWQIHNQLKRFFAERGTCYISIKSVSITFDGFPEFADWVNLKKNR